MSIIPTPRKSRRAGFSLIELLLVMTLAPIIFFAVYANFSTGIRLWQRLQVDTPEEDLVIFAQKAQRDFENATRYSLIPFEGGKDEAVFAARIEAEPALGGDRSIGQVRYYYDENKNAIFREIKNISEIYRDASGTKALLLKGVRSFEAAYLNYDKLAESYVWNDAYQPAQTGNQPMAVRLSYVLEGTNKRMEQVIFIPAGGDLK